MMKNAGIMHSGGRMKSPSFIPMKRILLQTVCLNGIKNAVLIISDLNLTTYMMKTANISEKDPKDIMSF